MRLAAIAIAFLIPFARGGSSSDVPGYSERIQKIWADANAALQKAGDNRPIIINPLGPRGTFLAGGTNYTAEQIVITVRQPRTSPEYGEALLAHELTHVILNSRKFAGGANPGPKAESLLPPGNSELLENDATALISCFPDELIDRETTKRGFKPALINDATVGFRILAAERDNMDEDYRDIFKRLQALLNFCRLIRMSKTDRREFKSLIAAKMGPSVFKYTENLVREFQGKRCAITNPAGCYQLTRQLRHAAGLDGVFNLCTPNAIYWPWNCDQ